MEKTFEIVGKTINKNGSRLWTVKIGNEFIGMFEPDSIPDFYVYAPLDAENKWFLEWLLKCEFEFVRDFMNYMEALPIKFSQIEDNE